MIRRYVTSPADHVTPRSQVGREEGGRQQPLLRTAHAQQHIISPTELNSKHNFQGPKKSVEGAEGPRFVRPLSVPLKAGEAPGRSVPFAGPRKVTFFPPGGSNWV